VRSLFHHLREHPFAIGINERHFIQINNATLPIAFGVRPFPVRHQLAGPRTDQPSLENPFLLRRCLNDRDS
jgi:hypothetical protein